MLYIQVTLDVIDFALFEAYERQALSIMKVYQGQLISAFETARGKDGTGIEVHILSFPNIVLFEQYRVDKQLLALSDLRSKAVAKTEVVIALRAKSYG